MCMALSRTVSSMSLCSDKALRSLQGAECVSAGSMIAVDIAAVPHSYSLHCHQML